MDFDFVRDLKTMAAIDSWTEPGFDNFLDLTWLVDSQTSSGFAIVLGMTWVFVVVE